MKRVPYIKFMDKPTLDIKTEDSVGAMSVRYLLGIRLFMTQKSLTILTVLIMKNLSKLARLRFGG